MSRNLLRALPVLALLSHPLLAQQDTATITGQITDDSGLPLLNAAVSVTHRETNVVVRVTSGQDGIYVASPLRIGTYNIAVEAPGFKKIVQENIPLRVQDRLRIDFRLEIGDVTQTVEVAAEAPPLPSG